MPALLTESVTVGVLHRLYGILDAASRESADLGAASYAVLAEVAHAEEGISLRTLKEAYGFSDIAPSFQHQLEERELAVYVRSAADRRSLALRATPKGVDRAAFIDSVLATRILEVFPGLTEENFDRLMELCYAHAAAAGALGRALGLIPGPCLRQLVRFEHTLVVVASRFGMSALQVALLGSICDCRPWPWAARGLAGAADVATQDCVVRACLDVLRDRGLVQEGEELSCTDLGAQRLVDVSQRLSESFSRDWEQIPERERAALGPLLQYALYLFS